MQLWEYPYPENTSFLIHTKEWEVRINIRRKKKAKELLSKYLKDDHIEKLLDWIKKEFSSHIKNDKPDGY